MTAENKFFIYCLERYRYHHQLSGAEVMTLFTKYQMRDYISKFYPSLHTTSEEYIMDDIDDYLRRKQEGK